MDGEKTNKNNTKKKEEKEDEKKKKKKEEKKEQTVWLIPQTKTATVGLLLRNFWWIAWIFLTWNINKLQNHQKVETKDLPSLG